MRPLFFILLLCLSACATSSPSSQFCLPLVEYSSAIQKQFAKELSTLQNKPTIEKFLGDYKALRDADKVCLGR